MHPGALDQGLRHGPVIYFLWETFSLNKSLNDHRYDCVDGSDEDPDFCAEFECSSTIRKFKCIGAKEPPYCIPEYWVNDGMEDCENGYDESAACEPNTFRCSGENICLDMSSVCDGIDNCFDGSDEGDHCDTSCTGPLEENCSDCIQTPSGPTCLCAEGYTLNTDLHCDDINECSSKNGGCDHVCINSPGSYTCGCHDGYFLDDENKCQFIDSHQYTDLEFIIAAYNETKVSRFEFLEF